LNEDVDEKLEIERRKSNLIFHGVKEITQPGSEGVDSDYETAMEIIASGLHLDARKHVEEVQRIGKFAPDKIRPLRVKVKTFEGRSDILKRAKSLKEIDSYKKVFITPDLTRKQQLVDKELRDQVKKFRSEGAINVVISGGKVVKNLGSGKVQVLYQPVTRNHQ
jgi:hypothetical protein